MTPNELAKKLNASIPSVVGHLFKDAAVERGGRYHVGDINGASGESLVIYKNSGRFKDFSTGAEGDMLELLSLRYGSKQEGIKVGHAILGIPMHTRKSASEKQVVWKKPPREWSQLTENPKVLKYLVEERKIPEAVLKQAGVMGKDDEYYVFVRRTHETPHIICGAFYVGLTRKKIEGKEKKIIKQSDSPLDTLYGHDTAEKGVTNDDGNTYIIITGGQIDMLSYRSVGLLNSVSVPSGEDAIKWIEHSWDYLKGFEEIYIHMDNDETGNRATDKIAQKLGYERCRKCFLPAIYKDANEAHVAKYDLHNCIRNATEFKPDMLVSAGELSDRAIAILSNGRREDQGDCFLGWDGEESIQFRVRPREMTIITGIPGDGKSTIIYQQVAYLVFVLRQKCFIASLEEDPEVILGLIATQALATLYDPQSKKSFRAFTETMKVLDEYVWFYNYRGRAKASDVLKNAEYVVRKHSVQHVFFDSIAKTDLNIEKNEDCNEFVGLITKSMTDTGAHYYLVAHPRKGDGKVKGYNAMVGMDEVKGSSSLTVETFNCITMWKNSAKAVMLKSARTNKGIFTSSKQIGEDGNRKRITEEEIMSKGDGVIWISKQKVGGVTGRYDLFYNPDCYRLERNKEAESKPYAIDIHEEFLGIKPPPTPDF